MAGSASAREAYAERAGRCKKGAGAGIVYLKNMGKKMRAPNQLIEVGRSHFPCSFRGGCVISFLRMEDF